MCGVVANHDNTVVKRQNSAAASVQSTPALITHAAAPQHVKSFSHGDLIKLVVTKKGINETAT